MDGAPPAKETDFKMIQFNDAESATDTSKSFEIQMAGQIVSIYLSTKRAGISPTNLY